MWKVYARVESRGVALVTSARLFTDKSRATHVVQSCCNVSGGGECTTIQKDDQFSKERMLTGILSAYALVQLAGNKVSAFWISCSACLEILISVGFPGGEGRVDRPQVN